MARLSVSDYNPSAYNALPAFDIGFSAGVAPNSYSTVNLAWTIPAYAYNEFAIIKSTVGFPRDPSNGEGTALLDVAVVSSTTLTDTLLPGTEAFYAAYVIVHDPTVAVSPPYVWVLAGASRVVMPTNHGATDDFVGSLPAAFFTTDGQQIGGAVDTTSPMYKAAQSIGWVQDSLLTDIDKLKDVWNPNKAPSALVGPMGSMLGLPVDPNYVGYKGQRMLNGLALPIFRNKGNPTGIRLLGQGLSGLPCAVFDGRNLMPTVQASGFENLYSATVTLATAVGTSTATTFHVTDIQRLPLMFSTADPAHQILKRPFVMSVGSEWVQVTAADIPNGNLTVVRGVWGTTPVTYALNQPITLVAYDHLWDIPWGFTAAFPSSTATTTPDDATQPPLSAIKMQVTKRYTTSNVDQHTLVFGDRMHLSTYSRDSSGIGTLGFLQPHDFIVGQSVSFHAGEVSPNGGGNILTFTHNGVAQTASVAWHQPTRTYTVNATGGAGSGAVFNVTFYNDNYPAADTVGSLSSVTLVNAGTGYAGGNTLTLAGGWTGSNITVTVSTAGVMETVGLQVIKIIDDVTCQIKHTEPGATTPQALIGTATNPFVASGTPYVSALTPRTMIAPVVPGAPYSLSVAFQAQAVQYVSVAIIWYDSRGNVINPTPTYGTHSAGVGSSTWAAATQSNVTAPNNAVAAGIRLRVTDSSDSTGLWGVSGAVSIDNVQFEQKNTTTYYDDGGLLNLWLFTTSTGVTSFDPAKTTRKKLASLLPDYAMGDRTYRITLVTNSPTAPVNLSFSGKTGDSTISFFWNPPLFNGASPVTGYDLQWEHSASGSSTWTTDWSATNQAVTSKTVAKFVTATPQPYYTADGTTRYRFTVTPRNASGTGTPVAIYFTQGARP